MRTGLFGIAATRRVTLGGSALCVGGDGFHLALAMDEPRHAVQKASLHVHADCVFGAHGVWLNAKNREWDDLRHRQALASALSSKDSFAEVEGPLHGVYGNCRTQTLMLHGDFARQHPLFWTECDWGILFAYSMSKLVSLMGSLNVSALPDQDGASLLLTYGSILGDGTLIRGVKKLMPGHTLTWTPKGVAVAERLPLREISRDVSSLAQSTDLLDDVFLESVSQMVAVNKHGKFNQYNLLSGGLDSRLVTMATSRMCDASTVSTFCFSRRGSLDESISASLALAHGWRHHCHDLGQGEYMMHTETVLDYDGCVNYLASAHHRRALVTENLPKMGMLASGQGANVLLTDKHRWASNGERVLRSMELYNSIRGVSQDAASQAWQANTGIQRFKLVNRGFLYTNSGAYSTSPFGVLWSPFTSGKFVRTALRLDTKIVDGQLAYLTWLQKRFPEATEHIWERYNTFPVLGRRLRRAQAQALWRSRILRFLPVRDDASMSPIDMWLDSSEEIQHFYRNTFHQHSSLLQHYPELEETVARDFSAMNAMNKASVLTLLLATKAWFDS